MNPNLNPNIHPRKIVSPEVVGILDSRLPREITDEILEELLRGPREVVAAYRKIVRDIEWGTSEELQMEGYEPVGFGWEAIRVNYRSGIQRESLRCPDCGVLRSTMFEIPEDMETFGWMICAANIFYYNCKDPESYECIGGTYYPNSLVPSQNIIMTESGLIYYIRVNKEWIRCQI